MKMTLSAPSKTFLLGEYLALSGGPSLILNTTPRFELKVRLRGEGRCEGIHPNSPAGQWIRQNNEAFFKRDLEFVDPHAGLGGFGASSSQFLLTYAWEELSGRRIDESELKINPQEMWNSYQAIVSAGLKNPPSGADVVAQWIGGVSYFSSSPFKTFQKQWPFSSLGFGIYRTGHKIVTHKHLESVSTLPLLRLKELVLQGVSAFDQGQAERLVDAVQGYADELSRLNLVADSTVSILKRAGGIAGVKVVKGCGALGADTVLVLFDINVTDATAISHALGLELVADHRGLASGLQMSMEWTSQNMGKENEL
mgnify:CR=1 FL=1